jgi:hypothetical protein
MINCTNVEIKEYRRILYRLKAASSSTFTDYALWPVPIQNYL